MTPPGWDPQFSLSTSFFILFSFNENWYWEFKSLDLFCKSQSGARSEAGMEFPEDLWDWSTQGQGEMSLSMALDGI